MVELLDSWIRAVGPLAYVALFLAALIEYVFPPFPGDTVTLLGGVYAARGEKPWALVLAVVTLGSICGSALDYFLGFKLSHRFDSQPGFAERHPHVTRLREKMRHRGMLLIAFNRFLPGVRGPLFFASGVSRMPFRRVMLWGAFSAVLWNAGIMAIGYALGGNAERLEGLVREYNRIAIVLVIVVLLAVALGYVVRLRQAARGRSPSDGTNQHRTE